MVVRFPSEPGCKASAKEITLFVFESDDCSQARHDARSRREAPPAEAGAAADEPPPPAVPPDPAPSE